MSINFKWYSISIVIIWSPDMPEHTHNCLTLPTGECSGASRSCLALLGNAVTPLSLFLFHTLAFFLHYILTFLVHTLTLHSFVLLVSSLCVSLFARCNERVLSLVLVGNAVTPLSLFPFHTLTFLLHTFTFHFLVFFARNIFSLSFSFPLARFTLNIWTGSLWSCVTLRSPLDLKIEAISPLFCVKFYLVKEISYFYL